MFINANKLTSVMDNVKVVADGDAKNKPGIMLNIQDDHVDVYYSNGSAAAIIQRIDSVDTKGNVVYSIGADEYRGKAAFDYTRFCGTIDTCKESGIMKVHDIEFRLSRNADNTGKCIIVVSKYTEVTVPDEAGNEQTMTAELSSNEFMLNWADENQLNMKQKALANSIYENMFDDTDAELWDKAELENVLSGACANSEGKVVYLLDSMGGAFTPGSTYSTFCKTPHEMTRPVYLTFPYAKAIMQLTSKMNTNSVFMKCIYDPAGKLMATLIFDEDKSESIYFKATGLSSAFTRSIAGFSEFNYDSIQFSTMTEVLKDSLKSVQNTNAVENAEIKIILGETGLGTMIISANDTGASVKNEYKVNGDFLSTSLEKTDNPEQIIAKLSVNIKVFIDAISNNKLNHTAFDVQLGNDNRATLRVGYFDDSDLGAVYNRIVSEKDAVNAEATDADFIEARPEYLNTYNFFTATIVK